MAAVAPAIQHTAAETIAGVIHMPDRLRVHAVEVPTSGPAAAWSGSHRIVVAPLSISVDPTEGRPRRVSIGLQFRSIGTASEQPVILDVHPPTEFRPAATTGEASVTVTPELRLGAPGAASLGIAGSGSLTTRWQPGVPKIISGHGDATAFWEFESRQDWWPVGRLPMTILLAVPKETSEARLGLDVRVELVGGAFRSGATGRAANIVTLILQ